MRMNKISIISAALIELCSCAARADEVKITVADAANAFRALREISSGQQTVVKDAGKDRVIAKPYELSANAKLAIAKDILRLSNSYKNLIAEFQAAKTALCPDDDGKTCSAENKAKLAAEEKKIENTQLTIDLIMLNAEDLALDKNQIPPSVIAALGPVMPELEAGQNR